MGCACLALGDPVMIRQSFNPDAAMLTWRGGEIVEERVELSVVKWLT